MALDLTTGKPITPDQEESKKRVKPKGGLPGDKAAKVPAKGRK